MFSMHACNLCMAQCKTRLLKANLLGFKAIYPVYTSGVGNMLHSTEHELLQMTQLGRMALLRVGQFAENRAMAKRQPETVWKSKKKLLFHQNSQQSRRVRSYYITLLNSNSKSLFLDKNNRIKSINIRTELSQSKMCFFLLYMFTHHIS